jgi:hypothetical protein
MLGDETPEYRFRHHAPANIGRTDEKNFHEYKIRKQGTPVNRAPSVCAAVHALAAAAVEVKAKVKAEVKAKVKAKIKAKVKAEVKAEVKKNRLPRGSSAVRRRAA